MGVRVETPNWALTYPNAHDWFVTTEGDLQIYQHTATEEDCTVAEYARKNWQRVYYDPMPELPENDGQTYEKEDK